MRDRDELHRLESRLVEFYRTAADYPAFATPSDHPALWQEIREIAKQFQAERGACRILEVGAGRSGFGLDLRSRGLDGIHLTSQDVVESCAEFLSRTSDVVVTGSVEQLEGTWDIIFHSYVYEHVCRPREFTQELWQRLRPGGYLLMQSPRYELPFYLPPSVGHLSRVQKVWLAFRLVIRDLQTAMNGRPQFTVFSDPAVFHLPFRRDRDAVHRVRQGDLRRLLGKRAHITEYSLEAGGWKDWFVKRFLTLRLILRKSD